MQTSLRPLNGGTESLWSSWWSIRVKASSSAPGPRDGSIWRLVYFISGFSVTPILFWPVTIYLLILHSRVVPNFWHLSASLFSITTWSHLYRTSTGSYLFWCGQTILPSTNIYRPFTYCPPPSISHHLGTIHKIITVLNGLDLCKANFLSAAQKNFDSLRRTTSTVTLAWIRNQGKYSTFSGKYGPLEANAKLCKLPHKVFIYYRFSDPYKVLIKLYHNVALLLMCKRSNTVTCNKLTFGLNRHTALGTMVRKLDLLAQSILRLTRPTLSCLRIVSSTSHLHL